MTSTAAMRRVHIEVTGTVQGVGFRPYVYHLARSLGRIPPKTLVVGCEPGTPSASVEPAPGDGYAALSTPVAAAIDDALRLVASLLASMRPLSPQ